ncbi:helix-turn-helix domain-containing protein [Candidatus Williamhamiltonella defendens]|uniref:helix-turn-helix domain-containing protein n=1 Tax=Candidatus Williamhamiltonella defendens TaxID=138072 RepID=UPI000C1E3FD7|nr:helix-turn-helix transcriptional regulator [Candidatus Hamiltonella defensa]
MKSTLAQCLNFAMQSRNFSQGTLAKASRVSQSTIFKLTKGTSKGSKKIVDIAHALKVNPDWLARGVGEMEGESISSFISPSDSSNEVRVWNKEGETENIVNLPEGKSVSTWRAYILDRNSGCKEAPVGSIVIVDTAVKPRASDLVVAMISVYRFLPSNGPGLLSVDDKKVPLFDLSESVNLLGLLFFFFVI